MKLNQLDNFYIQDIIFTKEECNLILEYITKLQETIYTVKIDNDFIEKGCSLKSQDLEYTNNTKWVYDKVKSYISKNVDCRWIGEPHGVFRNYSENDFFVKHKDNVDSNIADKRYLTVSIQLSESEDYIGGDIIVNDSVKLDRIKGNTILWGTNVPHEVTKIKKGIRNALIFFVSSKHIENIKTLF